MINNKVAGVDIGGSHIAISLIDLKSLHPMQIAHKELSSTDTASNIMQTISNSINELIDTYPQLNTVGIAFPGPFNYAKGVSAIAGVGGKFEQTFGLHIQQTLKNLTNKYISFHFANDAHCFAEGANLLMQLKNKRKVFITLGTGFGSAFMEHDIVLEKHTCIPSSGAFYNQPFLNTTADDYFSSRWILNEYKKLTGKQAGSVKEIATLNDNVAKEIFENFGNNLGAFLLPWLNKFECNELIIGGNISLAENLFSPTLNKQLANLVTPISFKFCNNTEECILTGAAIIANKTACKTTTFSMTQRKTLQPLLPVSSSIAKANEYNIYPSYKTTDAVYCGFEALAQKIISQKIVIIDGFAGVRWENFREQLNNQIQSLGKAAFWYDINTCLKPLEEIDTILLENLNGNDPVFGKKYTGHLIDFFNSEKLSLLIPDKDADICIVYGTGAALSKWQGMLLYVDLPKNELQYRMRAGTAYNLACNILFDYSQMYKRSYFVDWPVLNVHKKQLLSSIDCIIDEQRFNEITWMEGNAFRNTLAQIVEHPFRARPWFEAGIWGGNWMKKKITTLNSNEVNYAWSFELITPENGIIIESNNYLLEVSFDFLLYFDNKKILGKAATRFGNEFPIRFDFLDTYNGGNLSIQCHPRTEYIKEKFGESFTQDETYYILDCEADAKVYLGFQNDINANEFKEALMAAQTKGIEMPIEKYVQKHTANKHDLFLIPNGTIHASGKNNLVLEISSTPYIFTFKMYDWLRLDLNGKPRPINIEHAFNNLYFDRKGTYVSEKLIAKQTIQEQWELGKKIKLSTHAEHFYTVDRYEFFGKVQINTNGQCHICMLVEGTAVEVNTNGKKDIFNYAETFIIPSTVNNYELIQAGDKMAYVVVAYIKDECC